MTDDSLTNEPGQRSGRSFVLTGRVRLIVGIVLWVLAVALSIYAQSVLIQFRTVDVAGILYGIAALLAVLGSIAIDRETPPPIGKASRVIEIRPGGWSVRSPRVIVGAVLVVLSIVSGATALLMIEWTQSSSSALWYWMGSLVLAILGLAIGSRIPATCRPTRPTREQLLEIAIVLGILAIAVALRLPDLSSIPPEVHGDESAVGLEARRVLRGQVPNLFTVGWYHIPYLSFAIPAPFMAVFGDNLYGYRLASVVQGVLSILLSYAVVKKLFSARVAALAAFFLAISHWHIHFSRDGINYLQALFAGVLVFYFLLKGIETRRAVYFLLAGMSVGLCLNVYYAARLAPAIAGLYILYRCVVDRQFIVRQWPGFIAAILGVVIFMAPMGVYYGRNWATFVSRTQGVFIFTPENMKHLEYGYKVEGVVEILKIQARNTALAFNLLGETSGQHNHKAPLIDFWTSALFVLGVVVVTAKAFRSRFLFVASWFWLTLIFGAVLTIDAPFSPRLIGLVPVLFIFPAIVIDVGWRGFGALFGRYGTYLFAIPVAVFLGQALRANYNDYFELHIKQLQPAGFYTNLSNYVLDVNDQYRIYFVSRNDTSIKYDTPNFLLPNVDAVDVRDRPLLLPLDRIPGAKGVIFIVENNMPERQARLDAIKQAYPNGREALRRASNGFPLFISYRVERDDLLAARPDALIDNESIPGKLIAEVPGSKGPNPTVAALPKPAALPVQAQAPPAPETARIAGPVNPAASKPANNPPVANPVVAGAPPVAPAAPVAPVIPVAAITPMPPGQVVLIIENVGDPRGLAIDANGMLLVADRQTGKIQRFDPAGRLVSSFGQRGDQPGDLKDPRAIGVATDGTMFVLDAAQNLINSFDANGQFIGRVSFHGYFPNGMALGQDGSIFVADTGQNRALKIGPSGDSITVFGQIGGDGQRVEQPTDIALDGNGGIFIADPVRGRVVSYNASLAFVREWVIPRAGTVNGPHIAVTSSAVYVTDPEGAKVQKFALDGQNQGKIGSGELKRPVGIVVGQDGAVYVADVETRRIVKYAPW